MDQGSVSAFGVSTRWVTFDRGLDCLGVQEGLGLGIDWWVRRKERTIYVGLSENNIERQCEGTTYMETNL